MSNLLKERTGESDAKGRKKACADKTKGAKGVKEYKKEVGEARVAGACLCFQHLGSRAWWISVSARPVKTTQ